MLYIATYVSNNWALYIFTDYTVDVGYLIFRTIVVL